MDTVLFLAFAGMYAVMLGVGAFVWGKDDERGLSYLLFLLTAALLYDNVVLGTGRWIGEGETLERLNAARYWLHALVTPLLALVSYDLARRAGSRLARHAAAAWAAWLYTLGLIALELGTQTLHLRLEPKLSHGVLSYASQGSSGAPWMVILVMLPIAAAAIALWRRGKTKALLWGILAMIVGGAIRLPEVSDAITNAFEAVLVAAFWVSVRRIAESTR